MDLKSFGEEEFCAKDWINKAWSSIGNQDKKVFLANTVSRLHLYMTQLTNSLDELSTQILNPIPSVLLDASTLQVDGSQLQQQLLSLEQKVLAVEEETGQSIASLQRIDRLKGRLENAASALREADKWAALATALEDTLQSGVSAEEEKLTKLTEQVAAMTASLEVLSDAPDYETKRLQLETLYNRLEAAVSASLIEALTQMNAEKTASYVGLFSAMGWSSSLLLSWRRSAASSAAGAWRRLDAHSLTALQATLAANCASQVGWLSDVLKSEAPLGELIRLYTDLLVSLEPSPSKVVSANLKLCSTPEEGILFLSDARSELDQFESTFSALLDAPRANKETIPPATVKELGRAIYAPLRELLPKYGDLQTQVLLAHLNTKELDVEDLLDRSKAFQSVVERSERWLTNSLATGRKIAGKAILVHFVAAVEAFTTSLTSSISSHARRIETAFLSSANCSGVLSSAFPAAVSLSGAVGGLLDILATLILTLHNDLHAAETQPQNPLLAIEDHLLDDNGRSLLASLASSSSPLGSVQTLHRLSATLRTLAGNILRDPVLKQLEKIPALPVWSDNDALSTELPDYALSPQEYITEVGQYLMTLPQHLEMHLSEKHAPWQYLTEVCNHTCDVYAEKLLTVRGMDALGSRRCLTDIAYLSSVVEDLGGTVTPTLANLEREMRPAQSAVAN